jgi:DNA-binding NtrC family response regulator
MREGARDFLPRPLTRKHVDALLDAFVPSHEVAAAGAGEGDAHHPYYIAGRSPRLLETVAIARKVAPTTVPVLVTGESGTGKELIARLIHHHSRRSDGPFLAVNCGALSETLLESELFGHERGAFTGAHARRKGRFELAHGGTLLMDEISETGPRLQAELLRVLEQQDFERLGGSERVRVNVRVVSTSNRDLAAEVEQGGFRSDLYYRLRGVRVNVPPLRERREDIPVLVWHFVNLYAGEVGRGIERLDEEMMDLFQTYAWPGNVRQLRNIVRTALILGEGPALSLAGAPGVMAELRGGDTAEATLALAELERRAIVEALRRTNLHQARAADLLGITDRTLREKLRRYRRDGQLPDDLSGGGRYVRDPERSPQWATTRT